MTGPISTAIAAELLVVIAIMVFAAVLVNLDAIASAFSGWAQ